MQCWTHTELAPAMHLEMEAGTLEWRWQDPARRWGATGGRREPGEWRQSLLNIRAPLRPQISFLVPDFTAEMPNNPCKTGRTPELAEMSESDSGTKRSVRKRQNISLHELLNRLFTPLKRAPRKLHVTRAHGVGDAGLWHLARLDSEHFMEG